MKETRRSVDLEKLNANVSKLNAAKLAYAERTSNTDPFSAYINDSDVKRYADTIFSELSYLFVVAVRSRSDISALQKANRSHISWSDIEAISNYGDQDDVSRFGGLLGAILNVDISKSPQQIIEYCKLRMYGEAIDAFRKRLGRGGAAVGKARSFSALINGDRQERPYEVEDTDPTTPDSASIEAEDINAVLLAANTLEEPYRSLVTTILHDLAETGDIDAVLEYRAGLDLSRPTEGEDQLLRQKFITIKVCLSKARQFFIT